MPETLQIEAKDAKVGDYIVWLGKKIVKVEPEEGQVIFTLDDDTFRSYKNDWVTLVSREKGIE